MDFPSLNSRDEEDIDLWDLFVKDGLVFPATAADDRGFGPAGLPHATTGPGPHGVAFTPPGSDSRSCASQSAMGNIAGLLTTDQTIAEAAALADDLNQPTGFPPFAVPQNIDPSLIDIDEGPDTWNRAREQSHISPFTPLTDLPAPQVPGFFDLDWPPFPLGIPSFPDLSLDDFINGYFPLAPMRSDLNQPPGSDRTHPSWASPTFTAPLVGQHDDIQVTLDLDSDLPADSSPVNSSVTPHTSSSVVNRRESSPTVAKRPSGRQTACVFCFFSKRKVT